MSRTPLMAGNWKMNVNHLEAIALVQKLAYSLNDADFDETFKSVTGALTSGSAAFTSARKRRSARTSSGRGMWGGLSANSRGAPGGPAAGGPGPAAAH